MIDDPKKDGTAEFTHKFGADEEGGSEGEAFFKNPWAQPEDATFESVAPCDLARYFLGWNYWNATTGVTTLVHWRKQFWEWDQTRWRVVDDDTMRSRMYKFLDKAPVKIGKSTSKYDPKSSDVTNAIDALKSVTNLSTTVEMPSWLGADPGWLGEVPESWVRDDPKWHWSQALIPLANGLLVPWNRKLVPHTPRFFSQNVLGYDYVPTAQAPRFVRYLNEIYPGKPDAQQGVKELIGIVCTDDLSYHKMWMFVGPKRGGRGTLGRVMKGMIGEENYLGTTFQTMGESFGMEGWIGKKLVVLHDATLDGISPKQMALIVERLKMTTGQDSQPINQKHIKHWNGTLNARVVTFSNEPILLRDASDAMPSRCLTHQMTESFAGREEKQLTQRLLAERSGILNLALDALEELAKRGHLIQPASGEDLGETLAENANDLAPFIRDRCVVDIEASELVEDLFAAYKQWARKNKILIGGWGLPQFSAKLSAACPGPTKQNRPRSGGVNRPTRMYGIGLRTGEVGPALDVMDEAVTDSDVEVVDFHRNLKATMKAAKAAKDESAGPKSDPAPAEPRPPDRPSDSGVVPFLRRRPL